MLSQHALCQRHSAEQVQEVSCYLATLCSYLDLAQLPAGVLCAMSDNKKPDKAHSGSGEGDGNRCNVLEWLFFIIATTGFLAFQLIVDAISEAQNERDVAWIARQSKCVSSVGREDENDDEDDDDDDNEDYDLYDDDDDDDYEELENLMDDESEEDEEDEMTVETGPSCPLNLPACNCELPVVLTHVGCILYPHL